MKWTPFLILFLGLILIFVEFFVPGAILGIAGGILIVLSILYFAYITASGWLILIYVIFCIALLIGLIRFALWKIKRNKRGKGIYLDSDQEGYVASAYQKDFIGKKGVALSDLGPSGHILVDGKRLQAVAKIGYIEQGTDVVVVGGEGAHLIVKRLEKDSE